MKKELIVRLHRSFEDHAHHDNEVEFWLARELQDLLGYTGWRNFLKIVDKAMEACTNAGQRPADHFVDVNTMIELGKGTQRQEMVGDDLRHHVATGKVASRPSGRTNHRAGCALNLNHASLDRAMEVLV